MEIGTFARSNEEIRTAMADRPDFVELRLDVSHRFNYVEAHRELSSNGVRCTLHLPSDPGWHPTTVSQGIAPYLNIARQVEADVVTFHSTLSSLFYEDEDIDDFLSSIGLACDAARETGVVLSVETLGSYYTEFTLLFDANPNVRMTLDIGHGQILAHRNRAIGHIDSFFDRIVLVNVHDNRGEEMVQEVLRLKRERNVTREEMREMVRRYDTHMPIGEGSIDFPSIFRSLKQHGYNGKFLMMCEDQKAFSNEREKFMKMWQES
ncbi:MAG: sugar phosphate isomerase/epimerase [Candidatus Thorarchaeota archaeon]|nr:sugar phosphate isomerase/epimerase [Candidatus Thorarchaeota archaeon]